MDFLRYGQKSTQSIFPTVAMNYSNLTTICDSVDKRITTYQSLVDYLIHQALVGYHRSCAHSRHT